MGQNILSCGRIFCHVFMDKQYSWMKWWMKKDELFMNIDNICLFCENLNKGNRVEKNYVGLS
jgi:hypothetical protein